MSTCCILQEELAGVALAAILRVGLPSPEPGALEYIVSIDRYNPDSGRYEPYLTEVLNDSSRFPFIQRVPSGYYRSVVNALLVTGPKTTAHDIHQAGSPGKVVSIRFPCCD